MKLYLSKRKFTLYFLISIAIFQVFIYLNKNSKEKIVEKVEVIEEGPKFNFNETIDELKKIENLEIIEITNKESKRIGVNISGNYENVIESINLLKEYKITNYKIDFDGKNYDVFAAIA